MSHGGGQKTKRKDLLQLSPQHVCESRGRFFRFYRTTSVRYDGAKEHFQGRGKAKKSETTALEFKNRTEACCLTAFFFFLVNLRGRRSGGGGETRRSRFDLDAPSAGRRLRASPRRKAASAPRTAPSVSGWNSPEFWSWGGGVTALTSNTTTFCLFKAFIYLCIYLFRQVILI